MGVSLVRDEVDDVEGRLWVINARLYKNWAVYNFPKLVSVGSKVWVFRRQSCIQWILAGLELGLCCRVGRAVRVLVP